MHHYNGIASVTVLVRYTFNACVLCWPFVSGCRFDRAVCVRASVCARMSAFFYLHHYAIESEIASACSKTFISSNMLEMRECNKPKVHRVSILKCDLLRFFLLLLLLNGA